MPEVLVALSAVVAIATAIRSVWSPCGLSMLSTITPLAEASRGHRFRSTALWFLLGSVLGGATLGGMMAALAIGVNALQLSEISVFWVVAGAALVTAASDSKVAGFQLPGHDRQVNERWLDRYRSWVYGAGFGWQIGVGVATYIMTAGVYLLILMGAFLVHPMLPIMIGLLFGLVRGLAVYLAVGLDTHQKLLVFHSRFERLREPVRRSMILVQAVVAVAAAWWAAHNRATLVVGLLAAVVLGLSVRGPKESVQPPAIAAPAGALS